MYTYLLAIINQIEENIRKRLLSPLPNAFCFNQKALDVISLHLTLELQGQKLSLIEEFALEKLRKNFSHLTDETEAYSNYLWQKSSLSVGVMQATMNS